MDCREVKKNTIYIYISYRTIPSITSILSNNMYEPIAHLINSYKGKSYTHHVFVWSMKIFFKIKCTDIIK